MFSRVFPNLQLQASTQISISVKNNVYFFPLNLFKLIVVYNVGYMADAAVFDLHGSNYIFINR